MREEGGRARALERDERAAPATQRLLRSLRQPQLPFRSSASLLFLSRQCAHAPPARLPSTPPKPQRNPLFSKKRRRCRWSKPWAPTPWTRCWTSSSRGRSCARGRCCCGRARRSTAFTSCARATSRSRAAACPCPWTATLSKKPAGFCTSAPGASTAAPLRRRSPLTPSWRPPSRWSSSPSPSGGSRARGSPARAAARRAASAAPPPASAACRGSGSTWSFQRRAAVCPRACQRACALAARRLRGSLLLLMRWRAPRPLFLAALPGPASPLTPTPHTLPP